MDVEKQEERGRALAWVFGAPAPSAHAVTCGVCSLPIAARLRSPPHRRAGGTRWPAIRYDYEMHIPWNEWINTIAYERKLTNMSARPKMPSDHDHLPIVHRAGSPGHLFLFVSASGGKVIDQFCFLCALVQFCAGYSEMNSLVEHRRAARVIGR